MISNRSPEDNSSSVYSIGTALAMDGLEHLLKFSPNDMPNIVCVNLGTLIRNTIAYVGELSYTNMELKIRAEIGAIAQDVKGMLNFAGIQRPILYLYWHGWTKSIPELLVRPFSKARESINNNVNMLLNRQMTLLDNVGDYVPEIMVSVTPEREARLPHDQILKDLARVPGQRKAVMLSHYPLDYHVINKRSIHFSILESYTGKISGLERLNVKIFDDEAIPFCGMTHQLLGDKEQIKSPLSRNDIKLIKDTAVNDRWYLFPTTEIENKVKKLGFGRYVKID